MSKTVRAITKTSAILFGSHDYQNNYGGYGTARSLKLLDGALRNSFKNGTFSNFSDNHFSRTSSFFDELSKQLADHELVILYFYGHLMERRDQTLYFAHKFSNPTKTDTHIALTDILHLKEKHPGTRLLLFVDSSPGSLLNSITLRSDNNVLLISRRVGISNNKWFNGGDFLTGCMAETFERSVKYIPAFSLIELIKIVAAKIKFNDPESCFQISGDRRIAFENLKIDAGQKFLIWEKDVHNFENVSRGSREDGIQNLYETRLENTDKTGVRFLAEYFAYTDNDPNVRKSALGFLSNSDRRFSPVVTPVISAEIAKVKFDWQNIPAGHFLMGSSPELDPHALPEEMPLHTLYLDTFAITRTVITNKVYHNYQTSVNQLFTSEETDLPVTNVSWYEALDFCNWLTFQLRAQAKIKPDEYISLPSEAEWEKAARGTEGLIYPWGNIFLEDHCNCRATRCDKIIPPGRFSPLGDSPYNLVDAAGNVWEWTTSVWGKAGRTPDFPYPYNPGDGREDLELGEEYRRVVRGGSFYYFDYCVRAATRNIMYPVTKHSGGGFRIVKKTISFQDTQKP